MFDLSFLQGLANYSLFGLSILDLIILAVIFFYAFEGYQLGFTLAFLDFLSFIASFVIALKFYGILANLFFHYLNLPIGVSNAMGFFLLALVSEITLNFLLRIYVYRRVIPPFGKNKLFDWFRRIDHVLGILPGSVSAFVIISFLLTLVIALPASPLFKILVSQSKIGSLLISNTATFEGQLNDIFGGALHETMNFLTVEPKSNETVTLHFTVPNGTIDTQAEAQMFRMVNQERTKRGIGALTMDVALQTLARKYSTDMFARGYFSHYNPEGKSPFDRMAQAGITYTAAGENLALAPTTDLAMQGLMNSPGHRANILSPNFHTIGIGVIDGSVYGKMFTQEFTD